MLAYRPTNNSEKQFRPTTVDPKNERTRSKSSIKGILEFRQFLAIQYGQESRFTVTELVEVWLAL